MIKGFSVTQVLGASGVTLSPSNVWNDAGTTFTGIRFNVTDTASNANSLLINLQVGGSSRFAINKDGSLLVTGSTSVNVGQIRSPNYEYTGIRWDGGGYVLTLLAAGVPIKFDQHQNLVLDDPRFKFGWSAGGTGVLDTVLVRDAANTIAQRNGANAQTTRIYGTYTDASNYRRVAIAMTTGGVASIAPEGAGTGASGNVLHISGLPTANPGPGILWNDGGTVKVGT